MRQAAMLKLRPARAWRAAANAATVAIFGLGLWAFAWRDWAPGVLGLMAAATLLDGLDGWLARQAGGPSLGGALLDAAADFAAFGVAPAGMLWSLQPEAGAAVQAALLLFLCAAAARLLRSARGYARRPPQGWVGLPMPACGWLAAGLALCGGPPSLLAAGLLAIAGLAISRRIYPNTAWMWRHTRGPALGVAAAAALAFIISPGTGLLLGTATYAVYPVLRPISGTSAQRAQVASAKGQHGRKD